MFAEAAESATPVDRTLHQLHWDCNAVVENPRKPHPLGRGAVTAAYSFFCNFYTFIIDTSRALFVDAMKEII